MEFLPHAKHEVGSSRDAADEETRQLVYESLPCRHRSPSACSSYFGAVVNKKRVMIP